MKFFAFKDGEHRVAIGSMFLGRICGDLDELQRSMGSISTADATKRVSNIMLALQIARSEAHTVVLDDFVDSAKAGSVTVKCASSASGPTRS